MEVKLLCWPYCHHRVLCATHPIANTFRAYISPTKQIIKAALGGIFLGAIAESSDGPVTHHYPSDYDWQGIRVRPLLIKYAKGKFSLFKNLSNARLYPRPAHLPL